MEEIWKDVVGYEGLYEVSSLGQVRSLCYLHTGQTKVLKPAKYRRGYLRVVLCKNGKRKPSLVHRLVAEAFIPNPSNLPQVNHKDEVKTNNLVFLDENGIVVPEKSNLEWCDCHYNNNFGTRNERAAKALSRPVLQYDKFGNLVKKWPSVAEVSRRFGWAHQNISKCCLGKRKSAYGFVWRYVQ